MLAFIDLDERVPPEHPSRTIEALADRALTELSPTFDRMYAKDGRPSIPPERLLKAPLSIALSLVRSERAFCEELEDNLLFPWFLDMDIRDSNTSATDHQRRTLGPGRDRPPTPRVRRATLPHRHAGRTAAVAVSEYLKDAPPRIFDVHVHYPWRPDTARGLPTNFQAEMLAYTCRRLNITKVALLGRPADDGWDATLEAQRMFPELVVPLAQVWLDEHGPDDISKLHERGFKGLKITTPARDYDHEGYFPLYARCEELGMPILFHTGIRGGPIDFLLFHPRDHELAERTASRSEELLRGTTRGAARMQPLFLDTIGVAFPRLKIIGAHLGYGLYDSACAVARWRRNVYFDISGGRVVRRHILDRDMIFKEILPEKLMFGSDCDVAHMSREVTAWMDAFEAMGMPAADQDRIFYKNAAEVFGYE
jgi:uncharacterized protein